MQVPIQVVLQNLGLRRLFLIHKFFHPGTNVVKDRRFLVVAPLDGQVVLLAPCIQTEVPRNLPSDDFVGLSRYENSLLTRDCFVYCGKAWEFSRSRLIEYNHSGRITAPGEAIDASTYGQVIEKMVGSKTISFDHRRQIARHNGLQEPSAPTI